MESRTREDDRMRQLMTEHRLVTSVFGGLVVIASGHAFDTIKTQRQVLGNAISLKRVLAQPHFMQRLYSGASVPALTLFPMYATGFISLEWGLRWQSQTSDLFPDSSLPFPSLFLAGAWSGAVTSLITTPVDFIKIRLQCQAARPSGMLTWYKSPLECVQFHYRDMYRCGTATLLRDVPGTALYFGMSGWLKNKWETKHWREECLASSLASVISVAVVHPLDTIKTRLQAQPRTTWTKEWQRAIRQPWTLYHGFTPMLCRSIPATLFYVSAYDVLLKCLD